MTLTATSTDYSEIGWFRVFAKPPGGKGAERTEITMFRNVPTRIDTMRSQDPFGDSVATITLAQITPFDEIGVGDLKWLQPYSNIDIIWHNKEGYSYEYRWEGFVISYDFSMSDSQAGITIQLKGALYKVDNFLAAPFYPALPWPYELLIRRAFNQERYPAGLGHLRTRFPVGWDTEVPKFNEPKYRDFLRPYGVTPGEKWTALTTRNTGSWEAMLTGYIQSLLSIMYAPGGDQWTIKKDIGRRPTLYLRQRPDIDDDSILTLRLGQPGFTINGSRDYTQSANVIYGQGTDETGTVYSGSSISQFGAFTTFEPFAFSPKVWPMTKNPNRSLQIVPKETHIRFPDGLSEQQAHHVADQQYRRFADPGLTGSITLTSDPKKSDGNPFPRMLIKAGRTLKIIGLFGTTVYVHAVDVSVSPAEMSVSITYDSKYRDQLTVSEVKARTRDALTPIRALQIGKFSNTVQDLLFPWSYGEGSGIFPTAGKEGSAREFFLRRLPKRAEFPYEEYTKRWPPKKHPEYYVRVSKVNRDNPNENWLTRSGKEKWRFAIPFKMAQAGTIRLSQICAYDKNGNVLPVRFHFSIYQMGNGPDSVVTSKAMPRMPLPNEGVKRLRPRGGDDFDDGPKSQPFPFFKGAFEQFNANGTLYDSHNDVLGAGANLVVGWGNYFEPAGYWPGRASKGAKRSGMLVDETPWTWDNTSLLNQEQGSTFNQNQNPEAGRLCAMIYCDDHNPPGGYDGPVFFMGRFFRQEPGV